MSVAADFAQRGFAVVPGVADAGQCAQYAAQISAQGTAGSRTLLSQAWCAELGEFLLKCPTLQPFLPVGHVAVQCTFFEKSGSVNWLVPVHQDLGIPVRERVEDAALRGWSRKEDGWYVQPPCGVMEQLVAVRLHLDPCCVEDGPVHVVAGSHLQGVISAQEAVAMRQYEQACLAQVGDVLVKRPLILHRSSKATGASRRRVLHFLFGPVDLPHGLTWPKRAGMPLQAEGLS